MSKMVPKWHRLLLTTTALSVALSSGRTQTGNVAPQPLGRLVDVGGYRVHLYCVGDGSPTVVITGAGYSFDWGLVQPEVAKFTRVCAYDHSGISWSDPGPEDTCSIRVEEIHSALRNSSIPGAYVLVGHSLGALVSRLYASKYPNEVAGMVIVDHALISGLFPGSPFGSIGTQIAGGPAAAPSPSVAMSADADLDFRKLPARDYQLHLWANSLAGSSKIMERNRAVVSECTSEVEAEARNQTSLLGDKPLIVLSTQPGRAYASQLLSLSLNSKQETVENSGHYIMVDRPDAVISAIHGVVEAAQNHRKLKN